MVFVYVCVRAYVCLCACVPALNQWSAFGDLSVEIRFAGQWIINKLVCCIALLAFSKLVSRQRKQLVEEFVEGSKHCFASY